MISLFKRKSKIAVEEIPTAPSVPVEKHQVEAQPLVKEASVEAAAPVEETFAQVETPVEEIPAQAATVVEEVPALEDTFVEESTTATWAPSEPRAAVPAAPVEAPAFDWSQASSLLGDDPEAVAEDMAEIVRELIASADAQFQELKGKKCESERQAISALAHQLRGSLLNFG